MCSACNEATIGVEQRTGMAWVGRKLKEVTYTVAEAAGERIGVVEGCIDLGPVDRLEALDRTYRQGGTLGVGVKNPLFLWPHATIPYEIDGAIRNRDRIEAAVDHYRQRQTTITLVDRSTVVKSHYPNWVVFRAGGTNAGCMSPVGCQRSRQFITVEDGVCTVGNLIHEIGHTIGLFHEQSRSDRDQYITVDHAKVHAHAIHNFNQVLSAGVDLGPYDYGSIMHYPLTAFGINGAQTIRPTQPLPPGVVVGQRDGLSDGDVAAIAELYAGA